MISYFFAYKISSGDITNAFPAENTDKYSADVKKAMTSIKPKRMAKEARGKKAFDSGDIFMYQKMSKEVMVCSISQNVKTDGDMYTLFADFYGEATKKKAFAKEGLMNEWLDTEIGKFNAGERISKGAKVNQRVGAMNEKIQDRITKELDKFDDLMDMNNDILEMEEDAKEAKQLATEVRVEAWWYNHKMTLLLFGSIGTIALVIFLFLFGSGFL